MVQHPDEGTIHGWLDGALSFDEMTAFESHLAFCKECTEKVAEARGLLAGAQRILGALDDVPAGVVPGEESLVARRASVAPVPVPPAPPVAVPAMADVAETPATPAAVVPLPISRPAEVGVASPPARRTGWWRSPVLRAAAVLLVVGGVTFAMLGRRDRATFSVADGSAERVEESLAMDSAVLSARPPQAQSSAGPAARDAAASGRPGSATESGTTRSMSTEPVVAAAAPARRDSVRRSETDERVAAKDARSAVGTAFGTGAGAPPTRPVETKVDAPAPQVVGGRAAAQSPRNLALERERAVTNLAERQAAAQSAVAGGLASTPAAPAPAPPSVMADTGTRADDPLRHPLVGCFRLDSAEWTPALTPAERTRIPRLLELDSLTATGGAAVGRGLVHIEPAGVAALYTTASWQPVDAGRGTVTLRGDAGSMTIALSPSRAIAIVSRPGAVSSRASIPVARIACR